MMNCVESNFGCNRRSGQIRS